MLITLGQDIHYLHHDNHTFVGVHPLKQSSSRRDKAVLLFDA
jgi:hypothetical protein